MEAKVIDGCISCGACIATCPEVFRFDEDGLAEAYAKVTPEHESAAIEAKEECPVAEDDGDDIALELIEE